MKHQLLYPMAVYVSSLWLLALFMFRTRVRAVKSGQVSLKYFKTYQGEGPPEQAVLLAQHYDNQFQVPILFLVTCALSISLDSVNTLTLGLAWLFVLSRAWHSWVHLGSNRVLRRAAAFALGWMAVMLLWGQLLYFALLSA